MSTRWYPVYQKGGPQLRVYLPNFWMKLVRPTVEQPPNVVQFSCSMQMTKFDIKNYLEKIYNIKCVDVRTIIHMPKTRKEPGRGYIIKDDDIKYAFITLPRGEAFQFPELHPDLKEAELDYEKSLAECKKGYQQFLDQNKDRPNMPGWFRL